MSTDLAIDRLTGDLLVAPNNDLLLLTGIGVVEQRMRVRLKIHQGDWEFDPTGGSLGSRLTDLLRLPPIRALGELPLVVKEALAPMTDIRVIDVNAELNAEHATQIDFSVVYVVVDSQGVESDEQILEDFLAVTG